MKVWKIVWKSPSPLSPNRPFAPKDAVGATILVRFLPTETGDYEPVAFQPIPKKEHANGPAEST